MSTKIYTAYRLRPGVDLWTFCADVKKQGQQNIREILKTMYRSMPGSSEAEPRIRQALGLPAKEPITWLNCAMYVKHEYGAQLHSSKRNLFDLDVSIAIRRCGRRYYLIPYCEMLVGEVLNFLSDDPRVEDYAYWNNTDRPEEVSARAWAARARTWDTMIKRWEQMLTLDICSYNGFYLINPIWEDRDAV